MLRNLSTGAGKLCFGFCEALDVLFRPLFVYLSSQLHMVAMSKWFSIEVSILPLY